MYHLAIRQNKATNALYSYPTLDAALAAFHSELAYRGDSRTSTMCVILDDFGNTVRKEFWEEETASTPAED